MCQHKGMKNLAILQLSAAALALAFQPASASAQASVEVDLLEVHVGKGDDHLVLDSTLTIGDGKDQFLGKVAGGSETRTSFDDLEVQALYSRALSDSAALHFGIRHDFRSGPNLTHGVAGIVVEVLPGLEAEHYFFVSEKGHLTGGAQLLLGVDIAPSLVLEPRLGLGWSAKSIPAEDLGHGLTDVEASLRLRYALSDNFNVYVGVVHERLVGSTRAIAVAAGDPSRVNRAVLGLGFGF
jgi:copper resistance protein B